MLQTQNRSHRLAQTGNIRIATLAVLGIAVAASLGFGLLGMTSESEAAPNDKQKVEIMYLSVTGEGPTAKAWYKGAPANGAPVQDALDRFADKGFRVSKVTENLRSTADAVAFVILLERVQ